MHSVSLDPAGPHPLVDLNTQCGTYLVREGKYAGHRAILAGGAGHGEILAEFQGIWEGKERFVHDTLEI